MRFRWTDECKHRVEFDSAENEEGLAQAAIEAVIELRVRSAKRLHDGKSKMNVVYRPQLYLHVQHRDGCWMVVCDRDQTQRAALPSRSSRSPRDDPSDAVIVRNAAPQWLAWAKQQVDDAVKVDEFVEAIGSRMDESIRDMRLIEDGDDLLKRELGQH